MAPSLTDVIRAARGASARGEGALFDLLLGASPDAAALARRLEAEAGVLVIGGDLSAAPEFSRWTRQQARAERAVLLRDGQGRWLAAMADPWDERLIGRMAKAAGEQPLAAMASPDLIAEWLREDGDGSEAGSTATQLGKATGPVVSFVDDALRAGFKGGASDVHFECDRQGVTAKFRLDGVMVRHSRLSGHREAEEAISRIKVLAALDITERRLPQDGRMRLDLGQGPVDLRVSIMPSVHGEDAVLRLLDKSQLRAKESAVTLDSLAFDAGSAAVVRELAGLPSGMLLVTGPTGSGKTTTVYAALSEINTGFEKIITIEDPVEYELTGVLQIPVNERKGLTFAKGLRSILRHDPDRILVGEIRDAETAEIAVQSALTGHQVFTTVHANSMSDIIGRFRHFDIDMFGFMSALNGVVVQRLLRRLCTACMQWRTASAEEQRLLAVSHVSATGRLPHEVGCPACRNTGYKGRFVVAEVHSVDDELRDLVTERAPMSALKAHALHRGVATLLERALGHVMAGETSLAEVRRVVGARVGP
jgi:general secretion pathway protein E